MLPEPYFSVKDAANSLLLVSSSKTLASNSALALSNKVF
jgi:hypothetical protein